MNSSGGGADRQRGRGHLHEPGGRHHGHAAEGGEAGGEGEGQGQGREGGEGEGGQGQQLGAAAVVAAAAETLGISLSDASFTSLHLIISDNLQSLVLLIKPPTISSRVIPQAAGQEQGSCQRLHSGRLNQIIRM